MSHKHLLFRADGREKVLRGATALADAVRVTLGPKSKCVLIERKWGKPLVCNDGVTIAKEIDLKDAEENLGARMIREAAERTGDVVGDGTSTSTVLAHAIIADGLRNIAAGASAVDLKRYWAASSMTCLSALESCSLKNSATKGRKPAPCGSKADTTTSYRQHVVAKDIAFEPDAARISTSLVETRIVLARSPLRYNKRATRTQMCEFARRRRAADARLQDPRVFRISAA